MSPSRRMIYLLYFSKNARILQIANCIQYRNNGYKGCHNTSKER